MVQSTLAGPWGSWSYGIYSHGAENSQEVGSLGNQKVSTQWPISSIKISKLSLCGDYLIPIHTTRWGISRWILWRWFKRMFVLIQRFWVRCPSMLQPHKAEIKGTRETTFCSGDNFQPRIGIDRIQSYVGRGTEVHVNLIAFLQEQISVISCLSQVCNVWVSHILLELLNPSSTWNLSSVFKLSFKKFTSVYHSYWEDSIAEDIKHFVSKT